jgi:heme exporter protein D
MQSLSDYLTMGGYAAFVWPAYGVAALVLIAFTIDSWRRVKRAETALRRLEATQPQASAKTGTGRNRSAVRP